MITVLNTAVMLTVACFTATVDATDMVSVYTKAKHFWPEGDWIREVLQYWLHIVTQ